MLFKDHVLLLSFFKSPNGFHIEKSPAIYIFDAVALEKTNSYVNSLISEDYSGLGLYSLIGF
jgi:hypothetical protein